MFLGDQLHAHMWKEKFVQIIFDHHSEMWWLLCEHTNHVHEFSEQLGDKYHMQHLFPSTVYIFKQLWFSRNVGENINTGRDL